MQTSDARSGVTMKVISLPPDRSGMTLIEWVLVLLVLTVLLAILIPAGTHQNRRSKTVVCLSNQKQLLWASIQFAEEHGGLFSPQVCANEGGSLDFVSNRFAYYHFLTLSNYVGRNAKVFFCPASGKTAATNFTAFNDSHLSYFINLDAATQRTNHILIGDEFISSDASVRHQKMIMTKKTTLHWTDSHSTGSADRSGNLGFTDGHVAVHVKNTNLQERWLQSEQDQARFALPKK